MKKEKIDIVYLWCDGRDPDIEKVKKIFFMWLHII